MRAAFDYVNADLSRPATLADLAALAAHVHVSQRHLARMVKDESGMTPTAYVAVQSNLRFRAIVGELAALSEDFASTWAERRGQR